MAMDRSTKASVPSVHHGYTEQTREPVEMGDRARRLAERLTDRLLPAGAEAAR
jgi:phage replication-related protein YjqB (UPF0714/DUF867 family)